MFFLAPRSGIHSSFPRSPGKTIQAHKQGEHIASQWFRGKKITFVSTNFVFPRSETVALKEPKTFSEEQRRVFRAPDLREILRVFNGEECYPSGRASLMEGKWVGGSNFYVWMETAKPDTLC